MAGMFVETNRIVNGRVANGEHRYFDRELKAYHDDARKAVIDFGERVAMLSTAGMTCNRMVYTNDEAVIITQFEAYYGSDTRIVIEMY